MLLFTQGSSLFNGDPVSHPTPIVLIVSFHLRPATDHFAVCLMPHEALHHHDDGFLHLVTHHDPYQGFSPPSLLRFGHGADSTFDDVCVRKDSLRTVSPTAICRRSVRIRAGFSSCATEALSFNLKSSSLISWSFCSNSTALSSRKAFASILYLSSPPWRGTQT